MIKALHTPWPFGSDASVRLRRSYASICLENVPSVWDNGLSAGEKKPKNAEDLHGTGFWSFLFAVSPFFLFLNGGFRTLEGIRKHYSSTIIIITRKASSMSISKRNILCLLRAPSSYKEGALIVWKLYVCFCPSPSSGVCPVQWSRFILCLSWSSRTTGPGK